MKQDHCNGAGSSRALQQNTIYSLPFPISTHAVDPTDDRLLVSLLELPLCSSLQLRWTTPAHPQAMSVRRPGRLTSDLLCSLCSPADPILQACPSGSLASPPPYPCLLGITDHSILTSQKSAPRPLITPKLDGQRSA